MLDDFLPSEGPLIAICKLLDNIRSALVNTDDKVYLLATIISVR